MSEISSDLMRMNSGLNESREKYRLLARVHNSGLDVFK